MTGLRAGGGAGSLTDLRTRAASLASGVLERTVELARIPAPPGLEARRASTVAGWWRSDGWSEVAIDATGNVLARVTEGSSGALLVCAHLDTVFAEDVAHEPRAEGSFLVGPSVGDDSIGVASLSALATLAAEAADGSVWIAATVGEEGLGNLRGIRGILAGPPAGLRAVVAVEGNYLGRVSARGVGSSRWRVTVHGPGGHAWEKADAPSAIHEAGRIVTALSGLRIAGARTAVNVGRIGGGEAINARATEAWLEVDIRADDAAALRTLEERVLATFVSADPAVTVSADELGRRPAGGVPVTDPLVLAATQALDDVGIAAEIVATSTDANAAHEAGIPAVALGVTRGGGEHTDEEWIDTDPVGDGLTALAGTVLRYVGTTP